jgi:hypothetical protein
MEFWLDPAVIHTVWDRTWNQWKHLLETKIQVEGAFVQSGKYRKRHGDWELVNWETALPSRLEVKLAVCAIAIGVALFVALRVYRKNSNPALHDLTKRAERGDVTAQLELGDIYLLGRDGISKDPAKATLWFMQAADSGDSRGQYRLGTLYAKGEGVSKDPEASFGWFMKSATQGYANAELRVGQAYLEGLGVPESDTEAYNWIRKAAEHGNVRAQYVLCLMYARGKGVQRDETLGYAWCLVAKATGEEPATDSGKKAVKGVIELVGKGLSQSQTAEAQSLAAAWWSARGQHSPMVEHSQQIKKPNSGGHSPATQGDSDPLRVLQNGSRPTIQRHSGNVHFAPSGCDSGHWVDSVSDNGDIVRLEDGSMWKVSDVDTVSTMIWLPTDDVAVCDNLLINTDSGDAVAVTRH